MEQNFLTVAVLTTTQQTTSVINIFRISFIERYLIFPQIYITEFTLSNGNLRPSKAAHTTHEGMWIHLSVQRMLATLIL